jgi:hypothetical protein
MSLQSAGLVCSSNAGYSSQELLSTAGFSLRLEGDETDFHFDLDGFCLSEAGKQIIALAKHETNMEFYQKVRDKVSKINSKDFRIIENN